MATRASATDEVDVRSRIDRKTVILVFDIGIGNSNATGATNIESISVMAAVGDIAGGVVNGDMVESEVSGGVDRETLDWGVLDVQIGNGGLFEGVSVEKLT